MKDATPGTIHLADYQPPAFLIDSVALTFRLDPDATRVLSRIAFRPNPEGPGGPLKLNGEEMRLVSARIDGRPVNPDVTDSGLTCPAPDAPFIWEAEVEIAPVKNTALEGLYMSNGMYCTQCEAQGFRRITYYPDRPDVMAVFSVRIESDLPVLLSNGNPVASGDGWAEWHDPWPKPAYLFALVAGDLIAVPDSFTTRSGREVALNIWVREGDQDKCAFALEALKLSMKWEEERYGLEYDLDLFNIVAVDDFNAGAMENKGLNVFNSALVLASPETATDATFERIESVIAHEYFHNWSGNRITCRDWFQLCLKEGLTVYRDQEFTSDVRSAAVKRIEDVRLLRAYQFREDGGPLAHPVRPESFVEINNFYTTTVYEKGAELIGMLKTLVGQEAYSKALDLYFKRLDGQAATIEDWLAVFEEATGRDLGQFKRWYAQAGTPRLEVEEAFKDGTYSLTFRQSVPDTPGQTDKAPHVIPIAVGLLSPNGDEVQPTTVLEMTQAEQTFTFEGLGARPVPSLLRNFSAPVILERDPGEAERAFLLANDTDPFNRWDAGRALARAKLIDMATSGAGPDGAFIEAMGALLAEPGLDPAFAALSLALPGEDELAEAIAAKGGTPDPDALFAARAGLQEAMAERLKAPLEAAHEAALALTGPYRPDPGPAGIRAFGNVALGLLTRRDGGARATAQLQSAENMTQEFAALSALVAAGLGAEAADAFYERWRLERLVVDRWFSLQAVHAGPRGAAAAIERLTAHPDFTPKNPNRARAVLGAFAQNHAGFHAADGSGYRLLADWLGRLDPINPQIAARMASAFQAWRRYDAGRQAAASAALEGLLAQENISPDLSEMLGRMVSD